MRIKTVVADTRISTAELGEYHYQLMLQWAFVERQSKASFARNVLVARIEANSQVIRDGLEFYSSRYGLTVEQLQEKIAELDAQKKSISQILQSLEDEFKPQSS